MVVTVLHAHGWRTSLARRTAAVMSVKMPCFGFLTTKERALGGGKLIRNAFLALRLVHFGENRDVRGWERYGTLGAAWERYGCAGPPVVMTNECW